MFIARGKNALHYFAPYQLNELQKDSSHWFILNLALEINSMLMFGIVSDAACLAMFVLFSAVFATYTSICYTSNVVIKPQALTSVNCPRENSIRDERPSFILHNPYRIIYLS